MSSLAVWHLGGSGPRLVLVHGFTQTGASWRPIAEQLSDAYEVLAVDAPGHGGSREVEVDLAVGGELLVESCGAATYVGYSMGGRFALQAALARSDAVERLVLLGATAGIQDPAQREARCAADEALAASLESDGLEPFLDRWLAQPLFAALSAEAAGRDERRTNTAAGLAGSLRLAGTGAQTDVWSRLVELTMPVLLLAGSKDVKFVEIAARMASSIGTNAAAVLIEGAGHAAHLERPDAFVSALRSWLAAQPPSASPTPNATP